MILTVFIVFLAIAIILIFLGFYTDIRATALVGFVTLFLLGVLLASGQVYVGDGFTEINHLACGECNGSRVPLYRNFTNEYDNWTTSEQTFVNESNRSQNYTINVTINVPYNLTITEFIGYNNTAGNGSISFIASTDRIISYRALKDGTSKFLGIWLSLVSAIGFVLILINNRVTQK